MAEALQTLELLVAVDREERHGSEGCIPSAVSGAARHRLHLRGAQLPRDRLRRIEPVVIRCSTVAAMGALAVPTAQARQWPRPVGEVGLASLRTADRRRHPPTVSRQYLVRRVPNSIRIWRCPIWAMPTIPCLCTMVPMAVGVCTVV